jgi:hypothetical protein
LIRRRVFNVDLSISVLLCIVIAALWVRSHFATDYLVVWRDSAAWCYIRTVHGNLQIVAEPVWATWNGSQIFTLPAIGTTYLSMKSYTTSLTVPLWLMLAILVGRMYFWATRKLPPDPRFCPSCAYNLTGNTSGICPECGTPVPKEHAEKSPRPA